MENLDRIVADTMAQSGFETPVYLRPIPWSRWFRCESSFSLLLVPSSPGLYALAEEVAAPGETPSAKRMLAVFEIGETEDLCLTLSRQFAPSSPLSARLATGCCFVRFAQLHDDERRRMVCNSLKRWLAASAQTATGLANDASLHDIGIARDFATAHAATVEAAAEAVPPSDSTKADTSTPENFHPERSEAAAERDEVEALSGRLSPLPKSRAESREPLSSASPPTFSVVPTADPASGIATSQASSREATPEVSTTHTTELRKAAAGDEPPPLPSGF